MNFIKEVETESEESILYFLEDGKKIKDEIIDKLSKFMNFESGISDVQNDLLKRDLVARDIVNCFLDSKLLENKRMCIDVKGLNMVIYIGNINNEKGVFYNHVYKT